jgi:serine O-acetyltransferase
MFKILFNPSYQVIALYRLSNFIFRKKIPLLIPILKWWTHVLYSCEISCQANIGKNFRMPHPLGIVIGPGSIIKDNVTIFQNVTLGGKGGGNDLSFPIIESGVYIYSGAKILGSIKVGKNSIVGANSVVLKDVPSNSMAVGVPAKIIMN